MCLPLDETFDSSRLEFYNIFFISNFYHLKDTDVIRSNMGDIVDTLLVKCNMFVCKVQRQLEIGTFNKYFENLSYFMARIFHFLSENDKNILKLVSCRDFCPQILL